MSLSLLWPMSLRCPKFLHSLIPQFILSLYQPRRYLCFHQVAEWPFSVTCHRYLTHYLHYPIVSVERPLSPPPQRPVGWTG